MGRNGGCDFSELQAFADSLQSMTNSMAEIMDLCAKELAQRLIRKTIKRTPVGEYDKPVNFVTKEGQRVSFQPRTGKEGGNLRRGWSTKNVRVYHSPSTCLIEIRNPVEYASYVEYGHRTVNGGWVPGRFMMTISADEIQRDAPGILEKKIKQWMEVSLKR